jgi:N-acetylglucosaminyl-diphospho-decaprenol L-rhamnosyltransferase
MISVVIVNWNSGMLLQRCILSLASEDCEIVVVDNASTDGSLTGLSSRPGLSTIRNDSNAGFAAANNTGWRRSSGDPVLFLNPDVEALAGSIPALAEVLRADRSLWAAGGLLVGRNGKPQFDSYVRPFPSIGGIAAEMFFVEEIWPGNPWTAKRIHSRSGLHGILEVDQPAAACLMIRREVLEALDGFDEGFAPAWFEDVDLCKRIRDRGGRTALHTGARFLHEGGASVSRLGYESFVKIYRGNQIRYFAKHHGKGAAKRVRRILVAGMILRSAASILFPIAPNASRMKSAGLFWRSAREISGGSAPA